MTTRWDERRDDSKCSEDGERLRVRMKSLEAGRDVAGPDECRYTHTHFPKRRGFYIRPRTKRASWRPDAERRGAKTLKTLCR